MNAVERATDAILTAFSGAEVMETSPIPTVPGRGANPELEQEIRKLRIRRDAQRALDAELFPRIEPELSTLRDRLSRPREPVAYRIEEWQPIGTKVVLAAQFKAGKTTVTGNLARSLVDGDPFLGVAAVQPVEGRVVILDFEMSEHMLDSWLEDQRIQRDDRVAVVSLRGAARSFDLLDPQIFNRWVERLRAVEAEYAILDCLRPVLDALGLNEQTEAGRFLVPLDRLFAEAGIPEALIVHHMGHVAERSRGDSRIRDWPDVEWRLVREDLENPASARYFSAFGRDVDVAESRLEYDAKSRHLTLTSGSRREARAREALPEILSLLGREPGQSGRQIEKALTGAYKQKVVRSSLRVGIEEGSISTEPGPRKAILHFASASVRQTALPVRQRTGGECVSASIEDALNSPPDDGLDFVGEREAGR